MSSYEKTSNTNSWIAPTNTTRSSKGSVPSGGGVSNSGASGAISIVVLIIVVIRYRKRIKGYLVTPIPAQGNTCAVTPYVIPMPDQNDPNRQIVVFAPPGQALPYPLMPPGADIENPTFQASNGFPLPYPIMPANCAEPKPPGNNGFFPNGDPKTLMAPPSYEESVKRTPREKSDENSAENPSNSHKQ